MKSLACALGGLAGLSVVVTACGGSPSSPVAHVGPTAAESSTPAATVSAHGGAVAFARCMRSHGVAAYPDPSGNGLLPKKTPQQLGVGAATYRAAQRACIHLVPNGGLPTPAQVAQYRSAMLVYARCIRRHGVANMPDPDNRGHLDIGPGTDVEIDSPAFQAAYQACKSKLAP